MKTLPTIKFVYSHPYDRALTNMMHKEWTPECIKYALKRINLLEKEWRKLEKKVFKEMSEVTGLKWMTKEIKCYVNNYGSLYSDPLTIVLHTESGDEKRIEDIIDNIIHESIHIFFVSNRLKKLGLGKRFKNEELLTRNHIYLHALHKHLYLKFFGKERLREDIAFSEKIKDKKPGYTRAWEIVEKEGYKNLLKEIRETTKTSSIR